MSAQWKWVIGIVSVIVVLALLACGIFFAWRYLFGGEPSVMIVAPPSNYQVAEGEEVLVEARATGRSIVKIELWVDDGLVDSASSPSPQDTFSATLTWQATGLGQHTAEAKAYTLGGKESDPAGIILIVMSAEVAEATPSATVEPSVETPTPSPTPTPTPTSAPGVTPTPTTPPTATPTQTPVPPTATPTSPPPSCPATFAASPETQTQGSPFDLTWHVENATALHLSGPEVGDHVGVTGPDGSRSVCCPAAGTHTYTLHISCPAGDFDEHVNVTVNPPSPVEIYNFVDHMCEATWKNGAGTTLPCPGPDTDNRGFVRAVGGMQLEDGSTPARALETHPQWVWNGRIIGKYHLPWPIQAGDRFVAKVGFLKNASVGNVEFVLIAGFDGTSAVCSMEKPYNNALVDFSCEFDADFYGGTYVGLWVEANGVSDQDWAVWVNPRLIGTPR